MSQHFLTSTAARSLSLAAVARMSDDDAREAFKCIRWAETKGEPYCPKCGCFALYTYKTRHLWECKSCGYQFSVTSQTIFAGRKLAIRDYLLAIAIFVNGAKGYSALQLSRDLDVQYKTAYVLAMKLREVIAAENLKQKVSGSVEINSAFFGGYTKPANYKINRRDRQLTLNQNGKRRAVVVMRERGGKTLPFVFKSEHASLPIIEQTVTPGSTVYADDAANWNELHSKYLTKRIDHNVCYSDGQACTNQAESFFSRIRRAEIGTHHHIAGPYLQFYVSEMGWREDARRHSNGAQYLAVTNAALVHPVSRQWKGYWQRGKDAHR